MVNILGVQFDKGLGTRSHYTKPKLIIVKSNSPSRNLLPMKLYSLLLGGSGSLPVRRSAAIACSLLTLVFLPIILFLLLSFETIIKFAQLDA